MAGTSGDVQSLTSFRRQLASLLKRLSVSKRPLVLTVRGKAAAVVLNAEDYQRLLDVAATADAEEGIRQGLEDAGNGRTRSVEEFFAEFEAENGIPA